MKIKNNFRSPVFTGLFLMSSLFFFSQCKKDDNAEVLNQDPAVELGSDTAASISSLPSSKILASTGTVSASATAVTLDPTKMTTDGGFAYIINVDATLIGDASTQPTISTMRVFENSVELNPAHAAHADIRSLGKGRFSHWGKSLRFSASDNSNPSTNGRKYTYSTGSSVPVPVLAISSFSPTSAASGATVTITGTNFTGATALSFGGTAAKSFVVTSATSISAVVNAGATGSISVTTPNGTVSKTGFTYTSTPTPPPVSSALAGYATVNGTTTGGQGGQTVTVSTLSALQSALGSSSPLIIKVSGTISGTGMITVKSNKTIIGLSGANLKGLGLAMYTVSNIIVQNLKFSGVVGLDCITIKEGSHHIWIDHCELWQDLTHGWDYYDGLIDVTKASDYVTISWCKLSNAFKGVLIGGGNASTSDIGKLHVTLHHNYFLNIIERGPSYQLSTGAHLYNNYFLQTVSGVSGYGAAARSGGTIRTDNNYFENISGRPLLTIAGGTNGTTHGFFSGASTNFYKNSGSNSIATAASTWKPTYSYTLLPVSDVPSAIVSGAKAI